MSGPDLPISDDAYEAGFEDARALAIAGLERFGDGAGRNVPGSYLMGVFAMAVQATYENRAAGVTQLDVVTGLGGLMGDVLAHRAAEPDGGEAAATFAREGGQGLVNGVHGVVRAWAPRDAAGATAIDARAVLDALAAAAAHYISAIPDPRHRAGATAWFAEQLGAYIGQRPSVMGRR